MKKLITFIVLINPLLLIAEVPHQFSPGEIVSSSKVNENFDFLDNQTKFFRNFFHPEPLTEYLEQEVVFNSANDEGKVVVSGETGKNIFIKRQINCPNNSNPIYLYVDDIKLPKFPHVSPIIIPENKNIKAKAPNGGNNCKLFYFKSKKTIEPVLELLEHQSTYVVPNGKILVLLYISDNDVYASSINNVLIDETNLTNVFSGAAWPFPLIFYRGTVIKVDGFGSNKLINGYLIDE